MEMEGGMSGVSSTGYSKTSQVEFSNSQSVTEKKTNQTQGNEYVQWIMFEFGINITGTFFCQ